MIAAQSIDAAVSALRAGQTVILPTDTVYGLCVDPYHEAPIRRLLRQKKRPKEIPVALVASDLEVILDAVPELRGRAAVMARAILPGPYTLVLPNPARRYRWLTGTRPDTIGVRIPDLPAEAKTALDGFGAVAMTSANVHGGPDPARVDDIPEEMLRAAAVVVDAGVLPDGRTEQGIPSPLGCGARSGIRAGSASSRAPRRGGCGTPCPARPS